MRSLLNPWVILGVLVAVLSSGAYGYWKGGAHAQAKFESAAAREERIGQIAYESAQKAAAEGIANIRINNRTVHQTLEKEIIREQVYSECRHTPDSYRVLNEHLENKRTPGESAGGGELPGDVGPSP